ncbi:MAG: hypothetical protein AAF493_20410 [Pseudomonadota bacterium]
MQVVVVIAIVCCAVEICALVVSYLEPPRITDAGHSENAAQWAAIRWKVYWFAGLPVAVAGLLLCHARELVGKALLITGIYMMLFGINGGFSRRATSCLGLSRGH